MKQLISKNHSKLKKIKSLFSQFLLNSLIKMSITYWRALMVMVYSKNWHFSRLHGDCRVLAFGFTTSLFCACRQNSCAIKWEKKKVSPADNQTSVVILNLSGIMITLTLGHSITGLKSWVLFASHHGRLGCSAQLILEVGPWLCCGYLPLLIDMVGSSSIWLATQSGLLHLQLWCSPETFG